MVQNVWEKIAEDLCFVENSNFIRGSTEAGIHGWSGINSQKNTRGGVPIIENLKNLSLQVSYNGTLSDVFLWNSVLQNTSGPLEVLSENILKNNF